MNRYFSRLAQRSGVNANTHVARPGNKSSPTDPGWSEQSVEITSPIGTEASISKNTGIEDTAGNIKTGPGQIAPVVMPVSKANNAVQDLQPVNDGRIGGPPRLSTTLDMQSRFLPPSRVNEAEKVDTGVPGKTSFADRDALTTESFPETRKNDSPDLKKDRAHTGSQLAPDYVVAKSTNAFGSASIDSIVHSAPIKKILPSTPITANPNDNDKNNHAGRIADTRSSVRSEAIAAAHDTGSKMNTGHVTSSPAQTTAMPIQQTRTAPNSSVEVNIGKIELEIITPTKKNVSAPVAAPAKAPRSAPTAVFNPHRHYLRGR